MTAMTIRVGTHAYIGFCCERFTAQTRHSCCQTQLAAQGRNDIRVQLQDVSVEHAEVALGVRQQGFRLPRTQANLMGIYLGVLPDGFFWRLIWVEDYKVNATSHVRRLVTWGFTWGLIWGFTLGVRLGSSPEGSPEAHLGLTWGAHLGVKPNMDAAAASIR